jgi:uncharacterized protein (TIGR03437 family)
MPNDVIIIYAVCSGPTKPPAPAGQVQSAALPLASPFEIRIGQVAAPAQAFLAAGSLGLCQFNVTVPALAPGDHALSATVDGVATSQTLFTTVGQ